MVESISCLPDMRLRYEGGTQNPGLASREPSQIIPWITTAGEARWCMPCDTAALDHGDALQVLDGLALLMVAGTSTRNSWWPQGPVFFGQRPPAQHVVLGERPQEPWRDLLHGRDRAGRGGLHASHRGPAKVVLLGVVGGYVGARGSESSFGSLGGRGLGPIGSFEATKSTPQMQDDREEE